MKKFSLLIFVLLLAGGLAMGQVPSPPVAPVTIPTSNNNPSIPTVGTSAAIPGLSNSHFNTALGQDVLGAHNGYGRGCVMCHSPHSGYLANNPAATEGSDANNGMYALWGEDLAPLYGVTFNFAGDGNGATISTTTPYTTVGTNTVAAYPVTLPTAANLGALFSIGDASVRVLLCLSCHDGVLAQGAMMKGRTVETLPIVGGTAPTLLGAQAPSNGAAYNNDHPVGANAIVSCGGSYSWDCTGGGTTGLGITMNGTASAQFVVDYPGTFWSSTKATSLSSVAGVSTVAAVTCTTCHNQHSMTVYKKGSAYYPTMFFVKGEYAPETGGNSVSQFCRNCHGGESNEMSGVVVPTT